MARGMGLGQDGPLRHNKPCFSQGAFGFDLFAFERGKGLIPEGIAAFALELELSCSGDKYESFVLALGAGVKQLLCNSSPKVHGRSA